MATESLNFDFNFPNRVRNVSLSPTQENSLLPLFEAISNSIHSIEERFGKDDLKAGLIDIDIQTQDDSSAVDCITIQDNGIGLNEKFTKS